MKDYKTKHDSDGRIILLTKLCKEGSTSVWCAIGTFTKNSVKRFDQGKYSVDIEELITPIRTNQACD